MTNSPPPVSGSYSVAGIEVVELSDVDLDFVEEAFREGMRSTSETTTTEPAKPEELAHLELFRSLAGAELNEVAPLCQSIYAVPGYVLLAPGRSNNKTFFVLEGQLRLYPPTGEKRPVAIADVGHSTGLRSVLLGQPVNHSVIATEQSHLLAIERAVLDNCAKRSHAFARNYVALLESYLRGDNCFNVGARAAGTPTRQGYIDELTLLHNQHWLNNVFPRLVARSQLNDNPLAVVALAIDKLEQIIKQNGVPAGLRVLQTVGHWVLDQTRPTDLLAINRNQRIFAFLPDGDLEAARHLADRLKTGVQAVAVSLAKGQAPHKVTLSLGIARLEKGMKEKEFLGKAEALAQKSIALGGNCVNDAL